MPTTESKAGADAMNLGSVVLSVGLYSKGSYGWSSAPLFNALAVGTVKKGLNLLAFASDKVSVSRGSYNSVNKICVQPPVGKGNFKSDISVEIVGTAFATYPKAIAAKMGDAKACAAMGTGATTQMSTHFVSFKLNSGAETYTGLPTQW